MSGRFATLLGGTAAWIMLASAQPTWAGSHPSTGDGSLSIGVEN